jgi:hypothetical protein
VIDHQLEAFGRLVVVSKAQDDQVLVAKHLGTFPSAQESYL